MELTINEELQNYIPPLSEEEYRQLEESIINEGVRDPIIVWGSNRTIVDGHNRYNIAKKHSINFDTRDIWFNSIHDLKIWMIKNQFGRRNINNYQRSVLALELESEIAAKAKANLKEGGKISQEQGCLISDKAIDTKKELAKIAGVGHDTIAKVKKIKNEAPEEIKQQVKSGEISINQAYQKTRAEIKKSEVKQKELEYESATKYESDFSIDIYNTNKKFNIVYTDPPWQYWEGGQKNQSNHYPTMTVDEIKAVPVDGIADEDCILFIWVTFPIIKQAFEVIESWGFEYSTCGWNWVKTTENGKYFFGNGSWTRANSELCLIAKRGNITRMDAGISQILDDKIMEHSRKPKRVRELITRLVGELPRIEIFSRNDSKDGWYNYGNNI